MDPMDDKKKCICGMGMDDAGHAEMMAADPAAHHEAVDGDMPADDGMEEKADDNAPAAM